MVLRVLFAGVFLFCAMPAYAVDLYTVACAAGVIEPPADFFYPGYRLIDFEHDANGNLLPLPPETNTLLDPNLYSAWGVTFSSDSTLYIASSGQTSNSAVDYARNSAPDSLFSWNSSTRVNGPNYASFSGIEFPTAVGIVFTDGDKNSRNPFYIQAYDTNGALIPGSKVSIDYADGTWYTSFGEDAFVGIAYRDGISKLEWGTEYPHNGGLEVDNLMFGQSERYAVPEPATLLLLFFGCLAMAVSKRRMKEPYLISWSCREDRQV